MTDRAPIDVQDSFFLALRRDDVLSVVVLLSGEIRRGRLLRFDRFALVLEIAGTEEMIYKHAIASVRAEARTLAATASTA
jgi:host factor-I protein